MTLRFASLHAAFVLTLGTLALCPAPAQACSTTPLPPGTMLPPDQTDLHWGIGYAIVGGVDLAFFTTQIALHEDLFPVWLASIELVIATGQLTLGAIVAGKTMVESFGSCGTGTQLPIATAALWSTGIWLLVHAIWSFVDGDESEPPPLLPQVAIDEHGAVLGVIGVF